MKINSFFFPRQQPRPTSQATRSEPPPNNEGATQAAPTRATASGPRRYLNTNFFRVPRLDTTQTDAKLTEKSLDDLSVETEKINNLYKNKRPASNRSNPPLDSVTFKKTKDPNKHKLHIEEPHNHPETSFASRPGHQKYVITLAKWVNSATKPDEKIWREKIQHKIHQWLTSPDENRKTLDLSRLSPEDMPPLPEISGGPDVHYRVSIAI